MAKQPAAIVLLDSCCPAFNLLPSFGGTCPGCSLRCLKTQRRLVCEGDHGERGLSRGRHPWGLAPSLSLAGVEACWSSSRIALRRSVPPSSISYRFDRP